MLVTLDTLRLDGDPGDSERERSDKAHKNMNLQMVSCLASNIELCAREY